MCCILSTIRRHDTGQSGNYRTHIEGLGRETKHTRSDFFLPPTFGVEMANNEIYSMVFFFFPPLLPSIPLFITHSTVSKSFQESYIVAPQRKPKNRVQLQQSELKDIAKSCSSRTIKNSSFIRKII